MLLKGFHCDHRFERRPHEFRCVFLDIVQSWTCFFKRLLLSLTLFNMLVCDIIVFIRRSCILFDQGILTFQLVIDILINGSFSGVWLVLLEGPCLVHPLSRPSFGKWSFTNLNVGKVLAYLLSLIAIAVIFNWRIILFLIDDFNNLFWGWHWILVERSVYFIYKWRIILVSCRPHWSHLLQFWVLSHLAWPQLLSRRKLYLIFFCNCVWQCSWFLACIKLSTPRWSKLF